MSNRVPVLFDSELVLEHAVAAAVIGHLLWVLPKPRQRVSRGARILVLANVLMWLSFFAFGRPVDDAQLRRAESARVERDANTGELTLITDQPIIVAARLHGTFGATNFADWLLTLFASPAIAFAEVLIVPSRYFGIDATKRESFAIAGIGFVLSSCFWAAFGNIVSALRRRKQKSTRQRQRSVAQSPVVSGVSSLPRRLHELGDRINVGEVEIKKHE